MKEQRQQHSLKMEEQQLQFHQQRNSDHANTSSSAKVATATAATTTATTSAIMATATQMRATLIYLAPFLHPCKNVVPGIQQQTQTTTTATSSVAATSTTPTTLPTMLLSSHHERDANGGDVETFQKTHVALSGKTTTTTTTTSTSSGSSLSSSSSSSSHSSSGRSSNRNVTTMSRSSSTTLLHTGSRNNHNNNAINCNSTIINASSTNGGNGYGYGNNSRRHCCSTSCSSDGGSGGSDGSSSTIIRTSCCHNNAAQQQQQRPELKAEYEESCDKTKSTKMMTKDNSTTHKDKYYENYEMPALETTTTMFYASNNKIRQQQQHEQQQQPELQDAEGHLVVVGAVDVEKTATTTTNMKTDNPSLSSCSPIATTNTTNTSALSDVTVPVTGTPACLKNKQAKGATTNTLSFTAATTTTTSFVNYTNNRSTKYLRERGRRYYTMQQQQQQQEQQGYDSTPLPSLPPGRRPLKKHEEFELHEQRTKSPCGRSRGPLHVSVGGRRCPPPTPAVGTDDDDDAAAAVIDNHNATKCYNNNQMANTSLLSRCHCLNNMLSNAMDDEDVDEKSKDHIRPVEQQQQQHNVIINDNNVRDGAGVGNDGGLGDGHHNLILRNSSEACNRENEIFYPLSATATSPLSTPAVSSWPSASSSSSSSSSFTSSYTTILNKECRCFKNKRDIIIGSEMKRIASSSSSAATTSTCSSTSSAAFNLQHRPKGDDSCCLISNGSCMDKALLQHSLSLSTSSSISSSSVVSSQSSSLDFLLYCWWPWLVALFGCSKLTKAVTVSKWLFMWLLFIVLSSSAHCWAGRNDVPTNCTFPARWEGSWFLSGYQQSIHIKGSQFSYRGRCAASDGNKYLIVDEKGCHRCLVIYEKHKNVLQYKESECEGDSMYMHQTNPSAMAMRSVLNQKPSMGQGGDHRGGAHPNLNGHSRLSSSDQYIMRSNDDTNDYFCKGRETLQNLCDQIPGDALLYSLFRESAEPVKCPLKGPFIFTYNRGNGECKSPVSNIESCTEDSRLLLSFQACPDVVGTESTVEELTCLATWKDGNSRYLVGLVSHHHAISNEERYRCFVYEKISSLMDMGYAGPSISTSKDAEYKLAQSGDATCNGLDSAEVGSRIMSLRKPPITERCDFPAWFKGPRHWHVLMGNAVYNYHTNDGSIHIIKPNGYMDTRALCEQINKQTATEMMSVVHYTTGCQSGFMCMMFYRRDTHIIEIQTGKPASRLEDACAPDHFDINKTPYITLLASNPDPQICPMEGLYTLRGAIGPPYMTTRHKRNHNNKVHGIHNHHHQYESNERGFLHKKHTSLSFRNSNPNEKNAWHSNTRGLPVRSRRDASSTTTKPTLNSVNVIVNMTTTAATKDVTTQEILVVGNNTNVGFVQDPDSDTRLRSRRNVPECITNYKAQRQLWIGCTEPNVIDVRPLCNDEGDEEYSCHGSWTENGTVYIIARHKGTKHGVCISYRPTEGTNAKLVVGDACYRGTQKPPEHHLEANLSVFGKCGETGSTSATIPIFSCLQLMLATLLITLLSQLPIQR